MLGTRGIPATHGGVERAVEELSCRLAARGHQVTVFCRTGYCQGRPPRHRGVALRHLPAVPTKHLEAASHTLLAALLAAVGDFDVVHVHSVGPAPFGLLPRLAGKKVVVTVHALDWRRRKWGPVARAALRAGAWAAMRLPNATIVVSRAVRRYLIERYGGDATYLPNGVTPPAGVAAPPAPEGRYLLFLGRLVPEKRVDDLIAAFRTTPADARLVIAGNGHFSEHYAETLRRLAEGDRRIVFTGGVYGDGKETLLAGAAALVNPSDLEGHPIVVLEALSHGVPVLTSDLEEHREILEADGAPASLGTCFRTGDRGDLARGIGRVLEMDSGPEVREERRRFVLRHFDWDRIVEATESIYAAVATDRLPAPLPERPRKGSVEGRPC